MGKKKNQRKRRDSRLFLKNLLGQQDYSASHNQTTEDQCRMDHFQKYGRFGGTSKEAWLNIPKGSLQLIFSF
jgi:hypothetical protein